MNKKKYVPLEMNIVAFEAADIITTSTEEFEGEWVPIGGQNNNDGFFPTE